MSCSQVVSLETFAAHRLTFPMWKAPFPALSEDLKELIKPGMLTLQSFCILESVTSTVFSIMQLIYICKRLLLIPGFVFDDGRVVGNTYLAVPHVTFHLRPIHTAQRPQKCDLHCNASYLPSVRYVVCVGKPSRHMLKIRSI